MRLSSLLYLSLLLLISCQEPVDEKIDTSWSILYKKVLEPNCSNCHMNGSAIQKQSGLDLSSSAAYNSLVGVRPTNSTASHDGLFRVSTEGGMKAVSYTHLTLPTKA